jgi:hypothetical protein
VELKVLLPAAFTGTDLAQRREPPAPAPSATGVDNLWGATQMPDVGHADPGQAGRAPASLTDQRSLAVRGLRRGEVADEQMSALLMAIYFRGMTAAELRNGPAR